ncbi:hypothetical protein QR680_000052 [Steinernema hermaphroditum]|uniref:Uncharacterized protein n=1 Tax=Steinernema hermaphroditum TaxID=289476 RepID=A0AA39LDD6_9BILA|nr:hypothetical protein QR680_000052 [Steinernema hermaphroditum]
MAEDRVVQSASLETQLFNYIEQSSINAQEHPFLRELLRFLQTSHEYVEWKRSVDNSFAYLSEDVISGIISQAENLEDDKRCKEFCASYPLKCNLLKHICQVSGLWGRIARRLTCTELKGERFYQYSLSESGVFVKKVLPEELKYNDFINFAVFRHPRACCSEEQLSAIAQKLYGYIDMDFDAARPKLFQRLFPCMNLPFSKILLRCPGQPNPHIDGFIIKQIARQHLRYLQLAVNFSANVEPYIVKFVKSNNFEGFLANGRNFSAAFYQALYSVFMEKSIITAQRPSIQLRIDETTSQQIKNFLFILYNKEEYRNLEDPKYRTIEPHAIFVDCNVRTDIERMNGFSELKIWM